MCLLMLILFFDIPRVKSHVPVLWFLLIAHMLFPEQVVAMVVIIGDGHVEGATWILVMIHRHLDVDWTDIQVSDGGRGVFGGFSHPLAMILLGLAPLHPLHRGGSIHGHFAVVGATEDHVAHLPRKPFDDWVKSNFCHVVLAFVILKFLSGPHRSSGTLRERQGMSRKVNWSQGKPVLVLYLPCTDPVLGWLFLA
jgi:hypothetical protein